MKKYGMIGCAVFALWVSGVGSAFADEEATQLQSLLEKAAPAVVTVKALVKTEYNVGGQSQDRESRTELQGVVVAKEGIVMISNTQFSPNRFMSMLGGGREGANVKSVPLDFKVLFEGDEKEYNAFLVATDTKLDLAFLKLEDLGDRKLTVVDFTNAATPTSGQQVASISRLQKGYDYAAFFRTARISGEISKPRKAWMLDGGISDVGLPIFALTGETLGVLTTIEPGAKNESVDEGAGFSMLMRLLMGAGGGGMIRGFIVPNSVVNSLIAQAQQRAVTVAAERAKQKASKPAPKTEKDKTQKGTTKK